MSDLAPDLNDFLDCRTVEREALAAAIAIACDDGRSAPGARGRSFLRTCVHFLCEGFAAASVLEHAHPHLIPEMRRTGIRSGN